jgi:hypothetical protein
VIEVWVFVIQLVTAGAQFSDEHGSRAECEWARAGVDATRLTKDDRPVSSTRECVRVK